jgi:succinate dehydrogenase/fumarate reductase flavoprotein subunit
MGKTNYTRRGFLQGASIGAAGLGAASLGLLNLTGCDGQGGGGASCTYADTISWNAEYDVVVIGFGGAGGVSSIYAADAGARVLLCDVAPEGEEGGNTRFAAQMCVGGTDPNQTFEYYKGLAWHFDVDEDMLRTYTDDLCQMKDLLGYLGVEEPAIWPPNSTPATPEYPELEGSQSIMEWYVREGLYTSALWQTIRSNVIDRLDAIDVWFEAPAMRLIQDPQSHTVVGVELSKKGETVLVRARNGIVLSCGGFENNREMIQDYLGAARFAPLGTLHNNGDGIRLGMEVGADLWHMEAYESLGILSGNAWAVEDGHRALLEASHVAGSVTPLISMDSEDYGNGSVMLVGDDGGRFIDEHAGHRHGHVYSNGVWRMPVANYTPHLIFDETQYQILKDKGFITEEREALISSADTPEKLAELIGANPVILARTVADFNSFAKNGRDYQFERAPESMRALAGETYYAAAFEPVILNTQGGPRRNKNAEVIDTQGNPIPHLYSAGELGGICVFQYNAGGNLAECMVFGKIAGTNAALAKDPLSAFVIPQAVASNIKYQPGEANDAVTTDDDITLGQNEYLGVGANGMGGDIKVKVGYSNGTITSIEVISANETPEIGGKALEQLPEMVIAANSTDIDAVSGATITSKSFFAAVENAIAQA